MPNPSIDLLLGTLKPTQPNRFEVVLPNLGGAANSTTLNLLCDSIILPGINFSTAEYTAGRQQKKIPYTFTDDEVVTTFIEMNGYPIRKYFDGWMKKVMSTEDYYVNYKNEYTYSVKIKCLDKEYGVPQYIVELENAYPTNLSSIELSNGATDELTKTTVTFAYDKFLKFDF